IQPARLWAKRSPSARCRRDGSTSTIPPLTGSTRRLSRRARGLTCTARSTVRPPPASIRTSFGSELPVNDPVLEIVARVILGDRALADRNPCIVHRLRVSGDERIPPGQVLALRKHTI